MFSLSDLKCTSITEEERFPTAISTSRESDDSEIEPYQKPVTFGGMYQAMFNCSPQNRLACEKNSNTSRGRRGRVKRLQKIKKHRSNEVEANDCYRFAEPLHNKLRHFELDERDEKSEQSTATSTRTIHFLESNDQNVSRKSVFSVEGKNKVLISQHTFVSPRSISASDELSFANRNDIHLPTSTEFTMQQSEVCGIVTRTENASIQKRQSYKALRRNYNERNKIVADPQRRPTFESDHIKHNFINDARVLPNAHLYKDAEYGNYYHDNSYVSDVCRETNAIEECTTTYQQHQPHRGIVRKYVGSNPHMRVDCL